MSDEEIVKAVAEKVMGWELRQALSMTWWRWLENGQECSTEGSWNPLYSEADCAAVLEKMQERGWAYDLSTYIHGLKQVHCRFILGDVEARTGEVNIPGVSGESRRRAICLAALKAVSP